MDSTRLADSLRIAFNVGHIIRHQEELDNANSNVIIAVILSTIIIAIIYINRRLKVKNDE